MAQASPINNPFKSPKKKSTVEAHVQRNPSGTREIATLEDLEGALHPARIRVGRDWVEKLQDLGFTPDEAGLGSAVQHYNGLGHQATILVVDSVLGSRLFKLNVDMNGRRTLYLVQGNRRTEIDPDNWSSRSYSGVAYHREERPGILVPSPPPRPPRQ